MITPNLDDLGTENDKPFCLSISAGFSRGKHGHVMSGWWLSYALKYGRH